MISRIILFTIPHPRYRSYHGKILLSAHERQAVQICYRTLYFAGNGQSLRYRLRTFTSKDNQPFILCLDLKNTEVAEQLHDLQEINVSNLVFNINGKSMTEINRMINKMNEEIIRDSLTNTYNRRYMEERLLVDVFHAHNVGQPISVILSDIDLFKKVNDTYGHLAGDFVLKEFARIVMGNIRKNNDWVARYGGEEFLIVLLNADTNAAFRVAEKIRMAVENETIL